MAIHKCDQRMMIFPKPNRRAGFEDGGDVSVERCSVAHAICSRSASSVTRAASRAGEQAGSARAWRHRFHRAASGAPRVSREVIV